jgi:hypothetical protein
MSFSQTTFPLRSYADAYDVEMRSEKISLTLQDVTTVLGPGMNRSSCSTRNITP